MLVQKKMNKMKATGKFLAVCIAFWSLASPSLARESQQESSPSIKLKSEKTAMTLTLLGTLIPWGLFLQGMGEDHSPDAEFREILAIGGFFAIPIGPSLGYFYAGSTWRGLAGVGIRVVGLAGFIGAVAISWTGSEHSAAGGLALISSGLVLASSVFDIVQVKNAVRRHNLSIQGKGLAIVPVFFPRSKTAGLQIQFSF